MKTILMTLGLLIGLVSYGQNKSVAINQISNVSEYISYHENGAIAQKGLITAEGKVHGTWISYSAEGVKKAVARYNHGQKVGKWLLWQNNTLIEVTYDVPNKIASVSKWNQKTNVDLAVND